MGKRKGEKRRGEELSVIFDEEFGVLFETEAQDFGEFAKVFAVEGLQRTRKTWSWSVVGFVDGGMESER